MAQAQVQIHIEVMAESAEAFIEHMMLQLTTEKITEFLEGPANTWVTERALTRMGHEGDQASGAWDPLAPVTNEIRAALGFTPAHPINQRTGALAAWATEPGRVQEEEGAVGAIWPGTDPGGELAVKVEHAQQGGQSKWGNPFPARPVVAFDATDVAGIGISFARWFLESTAT